MEDNRINYTVIVKFKRSTYEAMKDTGEVVIVIGLSQPSSELFQVMISAVDVTAECE